MVQVVESCVTRRASSLAPHAHVCSLCWVLAAAEYATHVTSFLIRSQRTVNAVGPGKVAYQVTMAGTHDVNDTGLQQVVEVLGASPKEPLRLCFLVPGPPKDVYQEWQKKRFIVVPEALADRVRVYAVFIKVY